MPFRITCLLALAGLALSEVPLTTQPRRMFQNASGNSSLPTLSADGQLVVVGGSSSYVSVYQTRTSLLLREYRQHRFTVNDLSFMPGNSDTLVSADAGGMVRVWNAATLATYHRWQAPATVRMVRGQPGTRSILVASRTMVWLWDVLTDKQRRLDLPDNGPLSSVAFDASGTRLAIGYQNGVVVVQDVRTNINKSEKLGKTIKQTVWVGRDSLLAVGGESLLMLWQPDVQKTTPLFTFAHPVETIAYHPAHQTIAAGFDTGEVTVYRLASQELLFRSKSGGKSLSLQFDTARPLLLAGYWGSPAKTWLLP